MSTWYTVENGVRKPYIPTEEDIEEMEDAFGKPPTLVQEATRSFFRGGLNQLGYSSAQGLHSAITQNTVSARPMTDRDVILCRGKKVEISDLNRMHHQIERTELSLAAAEAAQTQAKQAYDAAMARSLNHVVPSIGVSEGRLNAGVELQGLGDYVIYDGPGLDAARSTYNQACTNYNRTLYKLGDEKAKYFHMKRAYDKQNGNSSIASNLWDAFWDFGTGVFGFTLRLLSQDF